MITEEEISLPKKCYAIFLEFRNELVSGWKKLKEGIETIYFAGMKAMCRNTRDAKKERTHRPK